MDGGESANRATAFPRVSAIRPDTQSLLLTLLLAFIAFLVVTPLFLLLLNSFQIGKPGGEVIYGLEGWRLAFTSRGIVEAVYNSFSLAIHGEGARPGEAEEEVGAADGLVYPPPDPLRVGVLGVPLLHEVHVLGAALVDRAAPVAADDVADAGVSQPGRFTGRILARRGRGADKDFAADHRAGDDAGALGLDHLGSYSFARGL